MLSQTNPPFQGKLGSQVPMNKKQQTTIRQNTLQTKPEIIITTEKKMKKHIIYDIISNMRKQCHLFSKHRVLKNTWYGLSLGNLAITGNEVYKMLLLMSCTQKFQLENSRSNLYAMQPSIWEVDADQESQW